MPNGQVDANVMDDGRPIDQVQRFCYLGSHVTPTNSIKDEINIRVGRAASVFQDLRNTWKAKIKVGTKMRIYNAVVITTLLYASET